MREGHLAPGACWRRSSLCCRIWTLGDQCTLLESEAWCCSTTQLFPILFSLHFIFNGLFGWLLKFTNLYFHIYLPLILSDLFFILHLLVFTGKFDFGLLKCLLCLNLAFEHRIQNGNVPSTISASCVMSESVLTNSSPYDGCRFLPLCFPSDFLLDTITCGFHGFRCWKTAVFP